MAAGKGAIPDRWLHCPRKSDTLIAEKFLAFKTPLCQEFSSQMPEECLFTPKMLLQLMKAYKVKIGLWIDLTNTNRFYERSEVEGLGCKYLKLKCRGHGEAPSREQTQSFIELVDDFIRDHPLDAIGVHCTHGFNRTGFLIVSYMVEKMDCSVGAALEAFAQARPPGIYKKDYVKELFSRYEDEDEAYETPEVPFWGDEGDYKEEDEYEEAGNSGQHGGDGTGKRRAEDGEAEGSEGGQKRKKRKKEFLNLNATFMMGVSGVDLFLEQPKLESLHRKMHEMCNWEGNGFPGCQPVSMDRQNIKNLHIKPYMVSWKADGTRYMMLVDGENEIYFFDRDFSCFKVEGLRFPSSKNPQEHIKGTLMDGEMVIDKVNGLSIPRYLVYDIVKFDDEDTGSFSFNSRLECIDKEIINPRHEAMKRGTIRKEREPFSVRKKMFWDLTQAGALLGDKFAKSLSHEPDGLIFQPKVDPYKPGRCDEVLKWKPPEMNSVDFRLKIIQESGLGMLPKKVGLLFVGSLETPLAQMKVTKAIKDLNNKIVECKFDGKEWVFMRERTDKSYPNSYTTAMAVIESIRHPVTKQILLEFIEKNRFIDDSESMPAPRKPQRP